jgi:hypothetical protein
MQQGAGHGRHAGWAAIMLMGWLLAACGAASTSNSGTTTQMVGTSATGPTPTPTGCQPFAEPGTQAQFGEMIPLPPQTYIGLGIGSDGNLATPACTVGGTQTTITAYLNANLPQNGWHMFDPNKDTSTGCDSVTWVKDHTGLAWHAPPGAMPNTSFWIIYTCSKVDGGT